MAIRHPRQSAEEQGPQPVTIYTHFAPENKCRGCDDRSAAVQRAILASEIVVELTGLEPTPRSGGVRGYLVIPPEVVEQPEVQVGLENYHAAVETLRDMSRRCYGGNDDYSSGATVTICGIPEPAQG